MPTPQEPGSKPLLTSNTGSHNTRYYLRKVRPLARQLFIKGLPGPLNAQQQLVVSGVPRSGTSWLAKTLSLCKGVDYYFEPDEALGPDYYDKYLTSDTEDERLLHHIKKSLKGHEVNEYAIAEKGLREIITRPFARAVLLKWVRMTLALDYFGAHFPSIPVIQLVRHPAPQFLSWQQRGWDPAHVLGGLIKQPKLMTGPLSKHAKRMTEANGFWESAATLWGAITTIQLASHRESWILKEHEWYCEDSTSRLRWLAESMGLEWTQQAEEFLSPHRSKTSGPGYGRRRDPTEEISKWKANISQKELTILQRTTDKFQLPFYPDMDPHSHWDGS
ncbi:hypothetical protein MIB92_12700 [Aestuariirhabdus sp. Z084]|uniref:hypothetical protein n=1 Tax=Aestuariirhabdus haliotis TaxID=2918751 RepID=UPI00201B356F|nr:hypothetical protein [Aestuariirhabdus haliotis]MCL6416513.1 hypothetical protein [Aestuariirhabdus haliotis]MCL6420503.1 hypothetical protein [Aestuariirhabdus haliotis]